MKTKLCIYPVLGISLLSLGFIMGNKNNVDINDNSEVALNEQVEVVEQIPEPVIVYDGLTLDELSKKLDGVLNSTLSGYGYLYASYSLEKGVDPYLAVAITLHETGCTWNCSYLVNKCNNVGGQKGSPSCDGGSYKKYDTLEEGIKGYIDNLYNGYVSKGLMTPETIGPKYAASKTWSIKINNYIEKIKAS